MSDKTKIVRIERPAEAGSIPPRPTIIPVSKEQAAQVAIGDRVSISVSGEVEGINKCWNSEEYEISLKAPSVEGIEGNHADKSYSEMTNTITEAVKEAMSNNPADYALEDVRD